MRVLGTPRAGESACRRYNGRFGSLENDTEEGTHQKNHYQISIDDVHYIVSTTGCSNLIVVFEQSKIWLNLKSGKKSKEIKH